MNTGTETSVLLFKLCDSAFEVGELCLPTVARVLGGYSVAVCTSLFTFLGGDGGARTFARGLVGGVRTGVIGGAGGRSRALEGRGGEGEGGRVDESTVLRHGGGSLERGTRIMIWSKKTAHVLGGRGCWRAARTRRQDT